MNKKFRRFFLKNPTTTVSGKISNIVLALVGYTIYLILVAMLFAWFNNTRVPLPNPFFNFPMQFGFSKPGIWEIIFSGIIFAPLWEELAFRWAPISLAMILNKKGKLLLPVILISSVIFGLIHGHGAMFSLMVQGTSGFVMAMLYLKNGFSYWSSVTYHAIWNFMVYFGFDIVNKTF